MKIKKTKVYACKKCGQVYYHPPPNKCMKMSFLLTGELEECDSTKIERIKQKDVINMHDTWDIFIEKLLKGDYNK